MKKKLLILITLLMMSFQLKAQEKEVQNMHFGLKAAPAIAWINTDDKEIAGVGTEFGFGYGLMADFKFSERYYFATGLDVTYRGGNLKSSTSSNDTTVTFEKTYSLQYIELPVTLKLKTNEIGSLTFYLQFGLAPGINIRGKADTKTSTQIGSNPVSVVEDEKVDIKDDINIFNLSMIISGGMEYTLSGSTRMLTAITFNNGFLDVYDSGDLKANTNFLALTVGILF